jgi:hypothetical protein
VGQPVDLEWRSVDETSEARASMSRRSYASPSWTQWFASSARCPSVLSMSVSDLDGSDCCRAAFLDNAPPLLTRCGLSELAATVRLARTRVDAPGDSDTTRRKFAVSAASETEQGAAC